MTLAVVPITQRAACAWINDQHGHLGPPRGWLLGAAVHDGERLCCVAVLERPARLLQNGTTACVSRVAADKTPHAASKALAAVSRAALALGYLRLVSYTLAGERGTSYRAAGWWITGVSRGGQWGREDRARESAEQPGAKIRWEYGPKAAPWDELSEAYMQAMIGTPLPPRRRVQMGLFGEVVT